jgi:hypothetical protein
VRLRKSGKFDDFCGRLDNRMPVAGAGAWTVKTGKLLSLDAIITNRNNLNRKFFPCYFFTKEIDRRHRAKMSYLKPPFIAEQAKKGTVALRNCHKHRWLGALPHGPLEARACILDHNITALHAMSAHLQTYGSYL